MNEYKCKVTLLKEMLGTNPMDPNVLDKHILDRQRKLIMEKSSINLAVNKYLDAKQISVAKGELELAALKKTLEELLERDLSDQEFSGLREGNPDTLKALKETFAELYMKSTTCFLRNPDNGNVCISSHMIHGYLKAAGESISRTLPRKNGTMLNSAAYTQSIINMHCMINPDLIDASCDVMRNDEESIIYLQRPLRAKTPQGPRIALAKSEQLPKGTEFYFTISVLKNSPLTKEVLEALLRYGCMKGLGQWRNAGYGRFEYEVE